MGLEGENIIVTGGSRGLGRSMCVTFAGKGANVAFSYSRDSDGAEETLRQAGVYGTRVKAFKASALDRQAMEEVVAEVDKDWGGVHALVNNAGVTQMLPMALMEEEDWDATMDVNVKGTYMATRAVLRAMIRRRAGRILNIGSVAGIKMMESPVHYAASKAAIRGFTEALAKEMGRYGITVNCLAPGILEGGMGDMLPSYRLEDYLKHCPLGRVGKLSEISLAAAFFISRECSYMSGVTIVMDGGL